LLAVSHEWWLVPGTVRVRYEDLLRDPAAELLRLAAEFGVPARNPVAEAVEATTIPRLRELTGARQHFWQGKSGLWRSLLTAAEAQPIAAAHDGVFADLGYGYDPDPALDASRADANWVNLIWSELAEDRQTGAETVAQRRLREVDAAYHDVVKALDSTSARLREVEALNEASRQALALFLELGPGALRLATRLRRLSCRYPRLSRLLRWLGSAAPGKESLPAA
jgi:hypothetical protein